MGAVLVAQADDSLRERIIESLAVRGLQSIGAQTAGDALDLAEKSPPILVIMDAVLPDVTGFAMLRTFRERPRLAAIPLVIVSRYHSEADRVLAFELGVDDFVAVPFFAAELGARIDAIVRSTKPSRTGAVRPRSGAGAVQIDSSTWSALVGHRRISLSSIQYKLLEQLMRVSGRVLDRQELIRSVWGEHYRINERVVDSHIKMLRRRLGEAAPLLETVRGRGYRFENRSLD